MVELLTYYVIAGALLLGSSNFLPHRLYTAPQNTKGRMVGYKDHKTYGDSSIYENTPGDNTKFYLTLKVDNDFNSVYNYKYRLLRFVGVFCRTII